MSMVLAEAPAGNSDIRVLTDGELDEVNGGGFWGVVALGLFTGASIVSGAIIVGVIVYAKCS